MMPDQVKFEELLTKALRNFFFESQRKFEIWIRGEGLDMKLINLRDGEGIYVDKVSIALKEK